MRKPRNTNQGESMRGEAILLIIVQTKTSGSMIIPGLRKNPNRQNIGLMKSVLKKPRNKWLRFRSIYFDSLFFFVTLHIDCGFGNENIGR